ncbi:MAG TPA: NADH-ubiquinone oxidoreductase-F iron-sulfur binding region domain-containing protein, partial [Bryobacteraceae bacterium]|nr:NADH-ubiquinone oxidoreductase-F iron-sulfur binding region domain-containing protein [Bryobacteraceae bacterium]
HGADDLVSALEQRFAKMGKRAVEIHKRSCLGQCDFAPALTLNEVLHRQITFEHAENHIQAKLAGIELPVPVFEHQPVELLADPYRGKQRYGALRQIIESRDWDGVIASLKNAGLGGMGGAGFPTSIKWDVVRKARGDEKYVVCNADESEPGTIKDRFIMTHLPHLVIEGIIIGALVVGARKGYLYIRHEYKEQEAILEAEIEQCRREGLLGDDILGSGLSFQLEIFVSPGGYICGEGSAQLEAIEGKRAEPRNKPPNSATQGLWQKPTALNNVETFANVPQILANGVDWFKSQGRDGASGLKFIGVSGDVRKPGIFEIPMGIPVSEAILGLAGGPLNGKAVKAFSPSGAASGFIPFEKFKDTHLDFKSMRAAGTMLGSGAIVVLDETRCILDMTLNAIVFFRNESCGKCVPCRMGSQKLVDILTGWTRGRGTQADLQLVADLAETMEQTSICGLGQFVPYPITTALKHFREEIEAHILHRRCPAGVCAMKA